jgi:hypothetical protein
LSLLIGKVGISFGWRLTLNWLPWASSIIVYCPLEAEKQMVKLFKHSEQHVFREGNHCADKLVNLGLSISDCI